MLIDRQLGDGTIFKRRAAEKKEEEGDQMERSHGMDSAREREADNNNGGKPRPAHHETQRRGGATPRDEQHSTTEILPGST